MAVGPLTNDGEAVLWQWKRGCTGTIAGTVFSFTVLLSLPPLYKSNNPLVVDGSRILRCRCGCPHSSIPSCSSWRFFGCGSSTGYHQQGNGVIATTADGRHPVWQQPWCCCRWQSSAVDSICYSLGLWDGDGLVVLWRHCLLHLGPVDSQLDPLTTEQGRDCYFAPPPLWGPGR